jgi:Spy/CpxP family protein refolding chaperone|tara:strand:- start:8034 stop:8525 length:492 start_codon:yes stop_codon:yes gene_type:complete
MTVKHPLSFVLSFSSSSQLAASNCSFLISCIFLARFPPILIPHIHRDSLSHKEITMKKLAIVALAIFTTSAFAYGPGHKGGEHMVERLEKKLALSEEQSTQLKAIFQEQGEKMKALHEETQDKMNKVLTQEQQEKLAEMKEKRMERRAEKKENRKDKKGRDVE